MQLTRSQQMARIRSTDTEPELRLRRALWAVGVRYRLQARTPAGRADLSSAARRIAVFVDGCFWHGCPEHYVCPRSRVEFWATKLRRNIDRDRRQTLAAEAEGWTVLRFWEHAVRVDASRVAEAVAEAWWGGGGAPKGSDWRVVRVESAGERGARETRYLEDLRDPAHSRILRRLRKSDKGWR